MKVLLILFLLLFVFAGTAKAQALEITENYYRGKVIGILEEKDTEVEGKTLYFQKVKLKIQDGELSGRELIIEHGRDVNIEANQKVTTGDEVVILETDGIGEEIIYVIIDKYRINKIIPIVLGFFVSAIFLSGIRGFGSIAGLILSLFVIINFIVPEIIDGSDPLIVSIVGCLFIMTPTIYLAHGFSRKTTIALLSTFLTLIITGVLSIIFVQATDLGGLGGEDAYSLTFTPLANVNFRGLLLGGILIGALGVLDDVTTSLTAAVFEINNANKKLKFNKLYTAGLKVGKEHIASLVNTLVLAYAGASLPIFLVIVMNPQNIPFWTILNSEVIMEEVVRTLSGSIGLVFSVPLTAFLAAKFAKVEE